MPYKSPAKRIKDEAKTLHHSRSSSDLSSPPKKPIVGVVKASTSYVKDEDKATRPGGHRLRRRSTLHWTGASPRQRQQKLEDVAAERMADTWFSVHSQSMDTELMEPIYVSEVMEKNMNPSFRFFDLEASGPQVTRSEELRLVLWAKSWRLDEYHMLIDLNVNLRSLQFIGRSLENFHHPLPSNCVLFHLEDGIYTSFTDMPVSMQDSSSLLTTSPKHHGEKDTTSSYDALMQLANLDDCIQDAIQTRQKMERSIESLLSKHQSELETTKQNIAAQESATMAERAVTIEQKQIRQLSKRRDELRKTLQLRREVIATSHLSKTQSNTQATQLSSQITSITQTLHTTSTRRTGQIRRIAETLSSIFPIEPLKSTTPKSLQFSILSLPLPNSTFSSTNRDSLAAALNFTAQLVLLLSFYLSAPLPYPITSTTSTIADPISVALSQREFPLYPVSVGYKFEYAVFLLNKDIEVLMAKVGLRMLDIRHTAPNLKYLLYVLTAGTGELPERKTGGVRGLVGRGGLQSPSLSRTGSSDSVGSQESYLGRINVGLAMPGNREKEGRGLELDAEDPFVGTSPRAKTMPFRSSLLRDAG